MSLQFLPHLILRCPRFSYPDHNPNEISSVLKDDAFLAAIFLSSRVFYNAIKNKGFNFDLLDDKEKLTLQNYYNRISFRTTPFGAFSSFTYCSWGKYDDQIVFKQPQLHFLLDQHYKQILMRQDTENFTPKELYTINPTIYKQGKNYRFIRTSVQDKATAYGYSLTTFRSAGILTKMLTAFKDQVTSTSQILAFIIKHSGCKEEDGMDFIAFLDDSQIILRNNFPGVLGKDDLPLFGRETNNSRSANNAIDRINDKRLPELKDVIALEEDLRDLLPGADKNKINSCFYVNLERTADGGLDVSYRDKLEDMIEVIKALVPPTVNEMLTSFAREFDQRFEKRALPLLEALDPVSGSSYGSSSSENENNTLLADINFIENTPQQQQVIWTAVHKLFLKKLTSKPGKTVQITDNDLAGLKTDAKARYPASMSVVFNVVNGNIIMGAAGGVSANALAGRFTPFNDSLLKSAQDVARQETWNNPEVIFAEVNHLSDSHIDNVNRRIPVYEYEIPINAMPVKGLKQIPLSDLYVSIVNGEIILESQTLKKRVVPRSTTAYNHQRDDLNLFRFLSDLQYQNISYDLEISLEKLFPDLYHYPRVEYKGSVLCPAKWILSKQAIIEISGSSLSKNLAALRDHRLKNAMPASVSLGFSDKQLYFDLTNDSEATLFIENIKTESKALIKEFIRPDKTCVTENGKPVIGQFIAFMINDEITYPAFNSDLAVAQTNAKRNFDLGSEWLYLQIHCSPLVANTLITEKIMPLMNKVMGSNADKWFFVRYYENGHHLRLRIHITGDNAGMVIKQIHNVLKDSLNANLIKHYKADTYHRELQRYGADMIDLIETVFFKSSIMVSAYLKETSNIADQAYYAYGFISTLKMLEAYMPDAIERANYTDMLITNFMNEFGGGKQLKIDLDKKYRDIAPTLSEMIGDAAFFTRLGLRQKQEQYEKAFALFLEKIKGQPAKRQQQLVADVIHMHLNRVFSEDQRKHEFVIYYCLGKKFRSDMARIKYNK